MGIFGSGIRGLMQRIGSPKPQYQDLQQRLNKAQKLLDARKPMEALEILEPLAEDFPNDGRLLSLLGSSYFVTGELFAAVDVLERALKLSRSLDNHALLFTAYIQLDMPMHALTIARAALRSNPPEDMASSIRADMEQIQRSLEAIMHDFARPRPQVEKGLAAYEDARLAIMRDEFPQAIDLTRRALKQLGPWAPLGVQLASAYFFDGRPNEAVAEVKKVLQYAPDDIFALESLIRYLTWFGMPEQAVAYWEQLKALPVTDDESKLRLAAAAAVMDDDALVADLLPQLLRDQDDPNPLEVRHLVAALANLGKHKQALQQLRKLGEETLGPTLSLWIDALKQKRPGPGYADRYPYYTSVELIFPDHLLELMDLMAKSETISEQQFRRRMDRFVARFPQVHLMCRKLIWEEEQVGAGVDLLITIGSPTAYAIVHEFACSQAGDDDDRVNALLRLLSAGYLEAGSTVRVWNRKTSQWQELQLITHELVDEPDSHFPEQELALLEKGIIATRENDLDTAEEAYKQLLALAPRAKEALNNLGSIYSTRGDEAAAKAMFQAACEIDPDYVYARCNLASFLLAEGDIAGARAMIMPLFQKPRLHIQEMANLNLTNAAIFLKEDNHAAARRSVEMALDVYPDLPEADKLLSRIEMAEMLSTLSHFSGNYFQDRSRAKREKMQSRFSNTDVSVLDAIGLFSVDVMKAISRDLVYPHESPHGRKRAALHPWLVAGILDPHNLQRIVHEIGQDARDALHSVVAAGGVMPWEDFAAAYDNDLEESVYWQYHRPETIMGRLRFAGLLTEATVGDQQYVVVPVDLRPLLGDILSTT